MSTKYNTCFEIRAYGKSELAMLYFPATCSAHTAVNHLMAWIRHNSRYFTPRQVALIVESLGDPNGNFG